LRQSAGLDIHQTAAAFGIEYPQEWFSRVHDLQEAQHIDFDGTVLKLTRAGRLVANSVIEELIWPNRSSIFEATP
jgi:hypothetical protein